MRGTALTAHEEKFLATIEDAASKRKALRFHYYSASSGKAVGARHGSVHVVRTGPPARFVATCHRAGVLRWFRVENLRDARLVDDTATEPFRPTKKAEVDAFVAESLDGFGTEPEELSFFVRDPEANWVARNLLDGMQLEVTPSGARVSVKTTARVVVARYVVGLGAAATPEPADPSR